MPEIAWLVRDPLALLVPVALFAGTMVAGLILRRILFGIVRRWAAVTQSHLDILLRDTLSGPIIIWSLILAVHVATQHSRIPRSYLHYIPPTLAVLWVWSFTSAAARFAGSAIGFYASHVKGTQSVTSLTRKLVQIVIIAIGLVWLLKVVFDMSLTPILTTLGVGGLAVALALQDTLSNLFAGFYVSISGLVRIGDYIRLNTGEEGYVSDINWRCTTLSTLGNNLIVVPNSKLGQAIYTNYDLPESRMSLSVSFSVGYDSDIERVEAILLEETIAAAATIPNLLAVPAPNVLFSPGPNEWALVFQVNFHISRFVDQYGVESELRKRLFSRLRREGITIPYPTRTIHLEPTKPA